MTQEEFNGLLSRTDEKLQSTSKNLDILAAQSQTLHEKIDQLTINFTKLNVNFQNHCSIEDADRKELTNNLNNINSKLEIINDNLNQDTPSFSWTYLTDFLAKAGIIFIIFYIANLLDAAIK